MKRIKTMLSLLLTVIMMFTLTVPAIAALDDTGFSDVASNAWYAEYVAYVKDNGIMSGTTDATFEPNASMNRAMFAMVLYRIAGSPDVSDDDDFIDTADDAWYSNAVQWASQQNLIGGYGNNLFGTNDAVSREQIASILWRYAGSPMINENAEAFADADSISSWAISAVNWTKTSAIINGKNGNLFDPAGLATRAEVATILFNYLSKEETPTPIPTPEATPVPTPAPTPIAPTKEMKALVVYFSMPETTNPNNMTTEEANSTVVIDGTVIGNTQYVAQIIQENMDADIFRIEPKIAYTTNHSELVDLASAEQENKARPELLANAENLEQYDVIFLGYPNWWGDMPMVLYTFLESHDLAGKTIIPFNTHGGSGFSNTIQAIVTLQPNATVITNGFTVSRNNVADCKDDVIAWLKGLTY